MTTHEGIHPKHRRRSLLAAAAAACMAATGVFAADPVKLGHVAALSGPSAQSGEAITRGLAIAIDEINAAGGVLGGRRIELIQRDDESNPPRGVIAARELIFKEKVAAFFGGIDSPVSLAIVPLANKQKVPFMGVWAAATPITRNNADPNYVFRVSAVDALVDVKLLDYAHRKFGATKAGLMLINNPWGESNEKGLVAADAGNDAIEIVGIEKFENNDVDMVPQLTRLKNAGADVIILVVNAPPGAQMMKSRERMGWTVAGRLALGHLRRPLPRARRADGRAMRISSRPTASSASRAPPGNGVLAALIEEVPGDRGTGGRLLAGRHRQRLRRHAPHGQGDRQGRQHRRRRDPQGDVRDRDV